MKAEDTLEMLVVSSFHLGFGDFLEGQDFRVEVDGSVEIGNGESDGIHRAHERRQFGGREP